MSNKILEMVDAIIETKGIKDSNIGTVITNDNHFILSYGDNEVLDIPVTDEDLALKVSLALNDIKMENFGIKDAISEKASQFMKNQLDKGKKNSEEIAQREDELKLIIKLAKLWDKARHTDPVVAKLFKNLIKMYKIVEARHKKLREKLSTKLNDKMNKTPEEIAKQDVANKARSNNLEQALALSYSELLDNISSRFVTSFDTKKVKDPEFGVVFQDKFDSLWETDPETDPDAKLLWESKRGKTSPLGKDKADDLKENKEDTDLDNLGGDDLDMDLNGEDTSEDLDLGDINTGDEGDLDLEGIDDGNAQEGLDLEGMDEGEGDVPTEPVTEQTATESLGQSLDKSLDTIKSMYNKLAKIVEG